jgi:AbrB family looped-hinge helix DNA binding protein
LELLGDSKLTRKFQVTVPKAVRKRLKLGAGDLLVFVVEERQILVKRGEVKIDA